MPIVERGPMPMPTSVIRPTAAPIQPPVRQPDTSNGAAAPGAEAQPAVKPEVDASRLAALSRQQATQRAHQRQMQEDRQKLEADRQAFAAEREQTARWKTQLTQDPYAVLLEAGMTAEEATAALMQQPERGSQKVTLVEKELAALKAELLALKSGQEESGTQALAAAQKQIAHDVNAIVAADTSLEAMKVYGPTATQAVVDLIQATFEKDGYVMDTQSAINEVEEYLVEEAYKASQLGKVKSRLAPQPPAGDPPADPKILQKQPTVPTLSTRMVPSSTKTLTADERRARAIAIAEGRQP